LNSKLQEIAGGSRRRSAWCVFALGLALAAPVPAAILTVTGTGDTIATDGTCTLREAITLVNSAGPASADCPNSGGAFGTSDEIRFNIPGAGVHTIAPTSVLPTVTTRVLIDGYSQTGATPNNAAVGWNGIILIEINGGGAGAGADGLRLLAAGIGSTVRGLAIFNFASNGIRLGDPVVSGSSSANAVLGNFIGLRADGSSAGNGFHGVSLSALLGPGNNADGNFIGDGTAAGRNVISANGDCGVVINGHDSNTISGNYIGVDPSGDAGRANDACGVWINQGADNGVISNVISGNNGWGVLIGGNVATANSVLENFIGVSASGLPMGNASHGVLVAAPNNSIGGANDGNTIAYNGGRGVAISSTGPYSGNRIRENLIYSNGNLGIDLNLDGVTLNDLGDTDTGPNLLQNFPVLTSASTGGAIVGTLNSTASTTFRVEFFSSPSCDSSGYGEGQVYLGSGNFATDGSGNIAVNLAAGPLTAGHAITATATNLTTNDTSEFSACITVAGAAAPEIQITGNATPIVDGDVTPSLADYTDFGTTTMGAPVTRTYTIANSGGATMTLGAGAVALSGAGCGEFSVSAQPATTVAAAGSTTFTVQYLPTNVGTDTCTVNVNNDDADENPYNFVIQGTGNAPAGTAAAIPTLSPWGLGLLSLLLGFGAAIRARRRR
jgi:hypothetical protein